MNSCKYKLMTLPDIEMYGGDTTPWEVSIVQPNGQPYELPDTEGFKCVLTIIPHNASIGIGNSAFLVKPLISKESAISVSPTSNKITALIELTIDDTISLKGKYIYQISLTNGVELYACQGHLLIKQNLGG